jgi:hypothetical protein
LLLHLRFAQVELLIAAVQPSAFFEFSKTWLPVNVKAAFSVSWGTGNGRKTRSHTGQFY